MRPKMTRGLSGKMVSAQEDESLFYFGLRVSSTANRSVKHLATSFFLYLFYKDMHAFHDAVKLLRFG